MFSVFTPSNTVGGRAKPRRKEDEHKRILRCVGKQGEKKPFFLYPEELDLLWTFFCCCKPKEEGTRRVLYIQKKEAVPHDLAKVDPWKNLPYASWSDFPVEEIVHYYLWGRHDSLPIQELMDSIQSRSLKITGASTGIEKAMVKRVVDKEQLSNTKSDKRMEEQIRKSYTAWLTHDGPEALGILPSVFDPKIRTDYVKSTSNTGDVALTAGQTAPTAKPTATEAPALRVAKDENSSASAPNDRNTRAPSRHGKAAQPQSNRQTPQTAIKAGGPQLGSDSASGLAAVSETAAGSKKSKDKKGRTSA